MSCLFINLITRLYISRSNIFEKTGSTATGLYTPAVVDGTTGWHTQERDWLRIGKQHKCVQRVYALVESCEALTLI